APRHRSPVAPQKTARLARRYSSPAKISKFKSNVNTIMKHYTRYSHPNFWVRAHLDSYHLYDYYNSWQWHVKKITGIFNQVSVWDFAGLSRPVKIALIDDSLEDHEDLPAGRIIPVFDFAQNDTDPDPGEHPSNPRGHGMMCAGVMAASHTFDSIAGMDPASGVISVNSSALLMAVKIFADTGGLWLTPESLFVRAVDTAWMRGANVLCCAWHTYDFDELSDAFIDAANHGCVSICSSGNTYKGPSDSVAFPARLSSCIAVGATDSNDVRWYYSNYDSTLDLVAPSGLADFLGDVWSIDQHGLPGFNPAYMTNCPPGSNDIGYACRFGGTSASCALAAGVASLVLSRDTSLSFEQVRQVLTGSAVALDSVVPSAERGYGRVDAFRAVLSIAHGDANNDALLDISDLVALVDYLWYNYQIFPSPLLGDCDCDGDVDVTDVEHYVEWLWQLGEDPPPPVKPCFQF
ncbi:MAG: S8 family serine peptidase, partial [Candidatus Zixiibacteriota bacterium]